MTSQYVEIRRGHYHDSVTLLSASQRVGAVEGVDAAQVAMATPLNLDVLSTMGFTVPDATPDDLVVALRFVDGLDGARQAAARTAALATLDSTLATRDESVAAQQEPPHTTATALRRSASRLVLVSAPGPSAGAEAWDALHAGRSVMLFSDNVDVDTEVALKRYAAERGLLVMGPDCGTAVVAGVGLGFANVVRPGPVSLVAASGTGAQQLLALLDAAGVGVRHCLGVGGRDLGAEVGGLAAGQALRMLASDDVTELVVLVSKPADSRVVRRLEALAAELDVAIEWAVLGTGSTDLTEVAERVCRRVGAEVPDWPSWPAPAPPVARGSRATGGLLRGLFAGGTLCDEAMAIASAQLGPLASNIPLQRNWPVLHATNPSTLRSSLRAAGHAFVDLGDDTLTVGRAHPLIDPSLRLEALLDAADDPRVQVVLLDLVLGHGAQGDPASAYGPAIRKAIARAADAGRRLDVVVSSTATRSDPQGRDSTADALSAAGAAVYLSNAAATRAAVALTREESG